MYPVRSRNGNTDIHCEWSRKNHADRLVQYYIFCIQFNFQAACLLSTLCINLLDISKVFTSLWPTGFSCPSCTKKVHFFSQVATCHDLRYHNVLITFITGQGQGIGTQGRRPMRWAARRRVESTAAPAGKLLHQSITSGAGNTPQEHFHHGCRVERWDALWRWRDQDEEDGI